jgi:hypothetical protein
MIIFLDTNIFFNNWHLKNANFKFLFNYASNTNSTILISEIVCDEVDNKVIQETNSLLDTIKSNFEKYRKILDEDITIDLEIGSKDYSFKKIITKLSDFVVFYDYTEVDNSLLVKRAIKKIKPFQDQDKGFRDTLIWLSFIDYIKTNNIKDDIIFINNNSTDFYNKSSDDFHSDLRNDIDEFKLPNKFKVYKTLHSFVSQTIDKSKHGLSIDEIYEDIIYNNERLIEDELENYISQMPILEALKIFSRNSESHKILTSISKFEFQISEGMEDTELLNYVILPDDSIYIELNFNLRIVDVGYTINTSIYRDNYDFLFTTFFNSEEINDFTQFYDYLRIDFNIAFTFKTKNKEIEGLVINETTILK